MTTEMDTLVRDNLRMFGKKIILNDSNDDSLQPHIGEVGTIRGVDICGALVVSFGNTEKLVWEGFDEYTFLK